MPDREKVIKALEICSQDVFGRMCINCTYESDYNRHCHEILMGDALTLLKEQAQPTKDQLIAHYGKSYKCKRCGLEWYIQTQRYCCECGEVVRFDE